MEQTESKFGILVGHFSGLMIAFKQIATGTTLFYVDPDRLNSFIENTKLPMIDRVKGCFEELGWEVGFDEEGNIWEIFFMGDKLGDEPTWMKQIAPFVDHGSYIEMVGEERETWRWIFENGKFREKEAIVCWD